MARTRTFTWLAAILLLSLLTETRAEESFSLRSKTASLSFDAETGVLRKARVLQDGWQDLPASGPVAAGRRQGEYLFVADGKPEWFVPQEVRQEGSTLRLAYERPDARIEIVWAPVFEDAFLISYRVDAKQDIESLSVGLDVFNLDAQQIRHTYCVPQSLPYFRDGKANRVPTGLAPNLETWNNTFSLITDEVTYSLSVLPPEFRLDSRLDPRAGRDYLVGFRPAAERDEGLAVTYQGRTIDKVGTLQLEKDGTPDHQISVEGLKEPEILTVTIHRDALSWTSDAARTTNWKCALEREGRRLNVFFSPLASSQTASSELPAELYLVITYRDGQSSGTVFSPVKQQMLPGISPNDGSILLVANHNRPVKKGQSITRRFLLAVSPNRGGYTTGRHVGQYMNLAGYRKNNNSLSLYRKSMAYLLDNPNAYTAEHNQGGNFFGAIHSGTGKPYGNGHAFYAMYGNSFAIGALNQYAQLSGIDADSLARLKGPDHFLLHTPVQNPDGSYWSMLDLLLDKGYCDQAFRKWVETHATGWVTYFLLTAHQISGEDKYLPAARKALRWLASVQREDGSFPKYFENGQASAEVQGDSAWNALAFFKAAELGLNVDGIDFKARGLQCVDWIRANQLNTRRFYGAFEDVGGVVESYTSSIAARAAVEAYRQSKDEAYLTAAEQMLTVSLAWMSCDYGWRDDTHAWDHSLLWQPAYGQIESTTCYYPCSYTLPMLYLAATEIAGHRQGEKARFWTQVARNVPLLDSFFRENDKTQAKYGMEWRAFPFLVFSDWGNGQTCWVIIETLKNRTQRAIRGLKFNAQGQTVIDGTTATIHAPKWDADGPLLEIDAEVDPLLLTTEDGDLYVILLAEGRTIVDKLAFKAASRLLAGSEFVLSDAVTGAELGTFSKAQLQAGVPLTVENAMMLRIHAN